MDSITEVLQLVKEYGAGMMAIAFFFWGLPFAFRFLFKTIAESKEERKLERENDRKMYEEMLTKQTNLLREILVSHDETKERKAQEDHAKGAAYRKKMTKTCNEYAKAIKEETGADRVAIHDYHNGTQSLSGIPYLRFKVTAMKEDKSVRRQTGHDSFAIECLGDFPVKLEDHGMITVKKLDKPFRDEYPELYKEMEFSQQNRGVFADVKYDGISVGFIAITFGPNKRVDYEKCQVVLSKYAGLLADILGNSDKFL